MGNGEFSKRGSFESLYSAEIKSIKNSILGTYNRQTPNLYYWNLKYFSGFKILKELIILTFYKILNIIIQLR
jgi:hypothetical protein